MKYKVNKKFMACAIASVMLSESVPIYAQNDESVVSSGDTEENTENTTEVVTEETTQESTENTTEIVTEEITQESTENTTEIVTEETTIEMQENVQVQAITEISSEQVQEFGTEYTTEQENNALIKVTDVPTSEISFKYEPFSLYGENNPTKERVQVASDEHKSLDANQDGYIDLSEKLGYEIPKGINTTLTNANIGKTFKVPTGYKYTAPTVEEDNINISEDLFNAIKSEYPELSEVVVKQSGKATKQVAKTQVESITELNLSYRKISDLTGIEHFKNLEVLDLSYNKIDDENFKKLLCLKNLKNLNVQGNLITKLNHEALANLQSLETINAADNKITEFAKIDLRTSGTNQYKVEKLGEEQTHPLRSIDLSRNPITKIEDINMPLVDTIGVTNLKELKTVQNICLPKVDVFDIKGSTKIQYFRLIDLPRVHNLEIVNTEEAGNDKGFKRVEYINIPNATRFLVSGNAGQRFDHRKGTVFKYLNAPNVTYFNEDVNFQEFSGINLPKYAGVFKLSIFDYINNNDKYELKLSNLNIPKVTEITFGMNANELIYREDNNKKPFEFKNINANSLRTMLTPANSDWRSTNDVKIVNASLNSLVSFGRNDIGDKIASGFGMENVSLGKATRLELWKEVEKDDRGTEARGLKNVYCPKVEYVSARRVNWGKSNIEHSFDTVNFDSLKGTSNPTNQVNESASPDEIENGFKFYSAKNLSLKGKIYKLISDAEHFDGVNETVECKNIIAPNVTEIDIRNKVNITELDDMANYPKLKRVRVRGTSINKIEELKGLKQNQLIEVDLQGSKIKDIGPLVRHKDSLQVVNTTNQNIDIEAYKENAGEPGQRARIIQEDTVSETPTYKVILENAIYDSGNIMVDRSGQLNALAKTGTVTPNSIPDSEVETNALVGEWNPNTNTITWTGVTDNNKNNLSFTFDIPYKLTENGETYYYSGTCRVTNVAETKPEVYDVQIADGDGVTIENNVVELTKEQAQAIINSTQPEVDGIQTKLAEYVKLAGRDKDQFELKYTGKISMPVGRLGVYRIQYKAVKKASLDGEEQQEVIGATRELIFKVSNDQAVFKGLKNYYTFFYGDSSDELISEIKSTVVAVDKEDGEIPVKVEFDASAVKPFESSIQYATVSATDSHGNKSIHKVPVLCNNPEVPLSGEMKRKVNQMRGVSYDTPVSLSDLEKITYMDISGMSDTSGIEYMGNVNNLVAGGQVDISFLNNLYLPLKHLNISNNNAVSENFTLDIERYPELEEINAINTRVSETFINSINGSESLRFLKLQGTNVKSLVGINFPNLEELRVSNIIQLEANLQNLILLVIENNNKLATYNLTAPQIREVNIHQYNGNYKFTAEDFNKHPDLRILTVTSLKQNVVSFNGLNLPNLEILDVKETDSLTGNLPSLRELWLNDNNTLKNFSLPQTTESLRILSIKNYCIEDESRPITATKTFNGEFFNKFSNLENLLLNGSDKNKVNVEGLNMPSLRILEFPNMENIENFSHQNLTRVVLPTTVKNIKGLNLPNLTELTVPEDIVSFEDNILPALIGTLTLKGPDLVNVRNNDLSSLNRLIIGDSGEKGKSLQNIEGNKLEGLDRIEVYSYKPIEQENNAQVITQITNNTFDNLVTFVARGQYKLISGIKSENLKWFNLQSHGKKGYIGTIQGMYAPNLVEFNLLNNVVDHLIDLHIPSMQRFCRNYWDKHIAIDQGSSLKSMVNVYAPELVIGGNWTNNPNENPESTTNPLKYIDLVKDCTLKKIYYNDGQNGDVSFTKIKRIENLTNKSRDKMEIKKTFYTEYITFSKESKDTVGVDERFYNNKIHDIDAFAKNCKIGWTVHDNQNQRKLKVIGGQKPEITYYYSSNGRNGTVELPMNEILKAEEVAKANNTSLLDDNQSFYGLTYDILSPTEAEYSSIDYSSKKITFNNINSGDTVKIRVKGNVKISNQSFPLSKNNGSTRSTAAEDTMDTVVTITFVESGQRPLSISGANDVTTSIKNIKDASRNIEGRNVTDAEKQAFLKQGVTIEGVNSEQYDLTIVGDLEIPTVGNESTSFITYTLTPKNNGAKVPAGTELPVVTRRITVTNLKPVISLKTPGNPISISSGIDNLFETLKGGVTVKDREDADITSKLKIYLVKQDNNEEQLIEITNSSNLETHIKNEQLSQFVQGANTIRYKVTDEDGNTATIDGVAMYENNEYLAGLVDTNITPKDIDAYNQLTTDEQGRFADGVSLIEPQSYDVTKTIYQGHIESTTEGTTDTIARPRPVETPEKDENGNIPDANDSNKSKFTIMYKVTPKVVAENRTGTTSSTTTEESTETTTQATYYTRKITLTNYKPRIIAPNDDVLEVYKGERNINIAEGVTAYDYEDGDIEVEVKPIDVALLDTGVHAIEVSVTDSDGNKASILRKIRVLNERINIELPEKPLIISKENANNINILDGVVIKLGDVVLNAENVREKLDIKYKIMLNGQEHISYANAEDVNNYLKQIASQEEITTDRYAIKYIVSDKLSGSPVLRTNTPVISEEAIREVSVVGDANVTDPNLIIAINRELGRNNLTQAITRADLLNLTNLDASNLGISNISGLKYATNLKKLNLSGNRIVVNSNQKLDLSTLINLKELKLSNLNIRNINNVLLPSGNLEFLDISYNNMRNVTFGEQGLDLTNLKMLNLAGNRLESVDISSLKKLETLNIARNRLSRLSLNSNSLVRLEASDNNISEINLNTPNLTSLNLSHNRLTNSDNNFVHLGNLRELNLSYNNLTERYTLTPNNNRNLKNLNISNNGITNVKGTPNEGMVLNVGFNPITEVSLTGAVNMGNFNANGCEEIRVLNNVKASSSQTDVYRKLERVNNCILPSLNLDNIDTLTEVQNSSIYRVVGRVPNLITLKNVDMNFSYDGDHPIIAPELTKIERVNIPSFTGRLQLSNSVKLTEIVDFNAPNVETIEIMNVPLERLENVVIGTDREHAREGLQGWNTNALSNLKVMKNVKIVSTANGEIIKSSREGNDKPDLAKMETIENVEIYRANNANLNNIFQNINGNIGKFTGISYPDAVTVDLSNAGIKNLAEIQNIFTPNVNSLNLRGNNISSISPDELNKFIHNITGNNDQSLNISLNLNGNNISARNIEEISAMPNVTLVPATGTTIEQNIQNPITVFGESSVEEPPVTKKATNIVIKDILNLSNEYTNITVGYGSGYVEGTHGTIAKTSDSEEQARNTVSGDNNLSIDWTLASGQPDGEPVPPDTIPLVVTATKQNSNGFSTYKANITLKYTDSNEPIIEVVLGQETESVSKKQLPLNVVNGKVVIKSPQGAKTIIPEGYTLTVRADGNSGATISGNGENQALTIGDFEGTKEVTLTYTLTNNSTRTSQEVTRKVIVVNKVPTIRVINQNITLIEDDEKLVNIQALKRYLKTNAVAIDSEDGSLDIEIQVNANQGEDERVLPGNYEVIYKATDSDNNTSETRGSLTVNEKGLPEIELFTDKYILTKRELNRLIEGSTSESDKVNRLRNQLVKLATVHYDGNVILDINEIDLQEILNNQGGSSDYEVEYLAKINNEVKASASMNIAFKNSVPELIIPSKSINVQEGTSVDVLKGVSARDEEDGSLNDRIEVVIEKTSGTNINVSETGEYEVGQYNIKYSVTDFDGNETTVNRKLIVMPKLDESKKPTVSINRSKVIGGQKGINDFSPADLLTFNYTAQNGEEIHVTANDENVAGNVKYFMRNSETGEFVEIREGLELPEVHSKLMYKIVYKRVVDQFANEYVADENGLKLEAILTVTNYAPKLELTEESITKTEGETLTIDELKSYIKATDSEDGNLIDSVKFDAKILDSVNLKVGTYKINITATDSDGNSVSKPFTVDVKEGNSGASATIGGGAGSPSKNPANIDNKDNKPIKDVINNEFRDIVKLPSINESVKVEFSDLPKLHWAKESISKMTKAGILKGDGKGNFYPNETAKRADIVIMLVNLLGLEDEAKTVKTSSFKDVRSDKYYAGYVELAKQCGLLNGDNKGNFNPENKISRQDTMVLISNVLRKLDIKGNGSNSLETFKDSDQISGYAKESVSYLVDLGIIKGNNSKISPKSEITRAEMAQVLNRVYDLIESKTK